jgi:gamma-D-glutamyl-L-lysine dipeptidyl-peptidase
VDTRGDRARARSDPRARPPAREPGAGAPRRAARSPDRCRVVVTAEVLTCRSDAASVRAEPDDASEQVTQAFAGEPLTVEERRDGWARIRTAYDYPGWIREDELASGTGTEIGACPYNATDSVDGDPIEEARAYLGAPYEWGGLTERGIDCSGLVHVAYRRLGRLVPRDADEQEAAARQVTQSEAQPGDLVCFGEPGQAHHIGFWLGEGRILHATGREGVNAVVEEPLENVDARPFRFVRPDGF